jgi:hypothetical protein
MAHYTYWLLTARTGQPAMGNKWITPLIKGRVLTQDNVNERRPLISGR